MNVNIINKQGKTYIAGIPGKRFIENEYDALDLLALCGEHGSRQILLYAENLTERFFDLKTRLAGTILQKFMNYGIQAVLVLPQEEMEKGRFREMALEANRGRHFRIFHDSESAEAWLLQT